jgi:hypothetical protein
MGVMRFVVHPPELISDWPEAALAYMTGMDGRIFPTRIEFEGNLLCCRRPLSDSGKLSVPWPVTGTGRPVLTTTSLREREEPYLLPLELARGKLAAIRDQAASWEMAKMVLPDAFRERQQAAFHCFAHASARQDDLEECCRSAGEAIELACQAADILVDAYIVQRLSHIRRTHHSPSLLGCLADETALSPEGQKILSENFNTASIPIRWTQVESREGEYHWELTDKLVEVLTSHRTILRGGPLLDLRTGGLPEWLSPWKDDFLNLPSFVCDFVDTAISRYTGVIRIWEVSAGGNLGGALQLNEEHRLALVARSLEAAIRTDSDSQYFIRIAQPWGEYQREGRHRLSPFQFVDALIRSNLGLTGVSLDINVGYQGETCFTRDLHSVSRLIDLWSMLGIQIHVNLACPSSSDPDPRADPQFVVQDRVWTGPWTEELQAEWMERIIPLLVAKPCVTGIFLEQFSDSIPHRYPHAGLLRSDATPKAMLDPWRRQQLTGIG